MKEYLKSQTKNNQAIILDKFSNDELERFSKSDYRWVDNREKQYQHRTVKKVKYISLNLEKLSTRNVL